MVLDVSFLDSLLGLIKEVFCLRAAGGRQDGVDVAVGEDDEDEHENKDDEDTHQ